MKTVSANLFVLLIFLFLSNVTDAREITLPDASYKNCSKDKFKAFQFETFEMDGHVLPYRFYQPQIEDGEDKYPLVIFFHGLGERGNNNCKQFKRFDPFPFWLSHVCYIIVPQCPDESLWIDPSHDKSIHNDDYYLALK